MKAFWYVQVRNERDSAAQRMIYAALEQGYEVHSDRYIPFDDHHDLSALPTNRPVVFHGAIGCARSVQNRGLPFRPFAWFNFNHLSCHSYYGRWGRWLVNQRYGLYPLGDLPRLEDHIYDVYGADGHVFIRPNSNDKIFTGEVVSREKFKGWMNWAFTEGEIPDAIVVVSEPQTIRAEWRLIVKDGRVVTGSRYKLNGQLNVVAGFPDEAAAVTEEACRKWTPHPVFVMDVGVLADGVYKIVECGSINCAGYYDCDLGAIVRAMSEVAEREYAALATPTPDRRDS